MKPDTIPCARCGGKGRHELDESLESTLHKLRKWGPNTAQGLSEITKPVIGVTAFNNRLERLRKQGFLTRTKVGREWVYSTPSQKTTTRPQR